MPALKGSKNALGNKGGGRKSAYQELQDALDLEDAFVNEQDVAALVAKIKSGKFSIFDRMKLLALSGKETTINKLIDKLVPTKIAADHTTKGQPMPTPILASLNNNSVEEIPKDCPDDYVEPQKEN